MERKKLELKGFEIVEDKEINCKSSDFEDKVYDEIKKNENLEEIKKEVMKNED